MTLLKTRLQSLPSLLRHTINFLVALAAILLLPGCSGDKKPPPKPPVPVVVAPVVQKDVPVQLKTIGNVEAYATVAIKARVGGELK